MTTRKELVKIMLKGNCINPQLATILAKTGHTDMLCVTDAGFPMPMEVERVDLAWTKGKPSWIEVCQLIKEEMVIEKIYLAEDIKVKSPKMYEEFIGIFGEDLIETISHINLKETSKRARAVIRTGEYTPFCNCIFVAGVAF